MILQPSVMSDRNDDICYRFRGGVITIERRRRTCDCCEDPEFIGGTFILIHLCYWLLGFALLITTTKSENLDDENQRSLLLYLYVAYLVPALLEHLCLLAIIAFIAWYFIREGKHVDCIGPECFLFTFVFFGIWLLLNWVPLYVLGRLIIELHPTGFNIFGEENGIGNHTLP